MYINENDIERGPLVIVRLLQPFNLLSNVGQSNVAILGGALNNLWSTNIQLHSFATRLTERLEAPKSTPIERIMNLQRVDHQLLYVKLAPIDSAPFQF